MHSMISVLRRKGFYSGGSSSRASRGGQAAVWARSGNRRQGL